MKEEKDDQEKRIPESCRIHTRSGVLEGHLKGRLYCFRGIPYARAARFQPPREYRWEGVYRAERFGLSAMQSACRQPGAREKYGEDCLNLNIYVPAKAFAAGKKLPAAVWLHGGAFQNGSGRDREGEKMIRDRGFLFISVEYRLGVLGYLYLGEALGEDYRHTGNNGTLDQLAALKWIHENIEAFGGDPERVTVFGESAGAKSLGALFLRPEMKAYCAQALMASGGWQSIRSERTAARVTRMFLYEGKKQGCPAETVGCSDHGRRQPAFPAGTADGQPGKYLHVRPRGGRRGDSVRLAGADRKGRLLVRQSHGGKLSARNVLFPACRKIF